MTRTRRSWVQGIYCGSVCSWRRRRRCCSWDYLLLKARGRSEEEGQSAAQQGPGSNCSGPVSHPPPHPAASPEPILGKGVWMASLLHTSSSQSPPESG